MVSLLVYKVALIVLLAGIPTSFGASAYYNQQQTNALNNHVSDLTARLDNANGQLSRNNQTVVSLNGQLSSLNGQISKLETQNSEVVAQIQRLNSEIANLTQNLHTAQIVILSRGSIVLPGYPTNCYAFNETCLSGGVAFINFTVAANVLSASLNITFAIPCTDCPRISLLSPSEYSTFIKCNCLERGNYTSTPTTWSSPQASSYTAQVAVPTSGLWTLVFQLGPGITNPLYPYQIDETIILTLTMKS